MIQMGEELSRNSFGVFVVATSPRLIIVNIYKIDNIFYESKIFFVFPPIFYSSIFFTL